MSDLLRTLLLQFSILARRHGRRPVDDLHCKKNVTKRQSQDQWTYVDVDAHKRGTFALRLHVEGSLNAEVIQDTELRRVELVHPAEEHANLLDLQGHGVLLRYKHLFRPENNRLRVADCRVGDEDNLRINNVDAVGN